MEKDEFLKEAEQEALLGLREGGIPIGGVRRPANGNRSKTFRPKRMQDL